MRSVPFDLEAGTADRSRLTLFHRARLPPGSNLNRLLERLDQLLDGGVIGHLRIDDWPRRATVDAGRRSPAIDRYFAIVDAADRLGVSIEPYFERYRRVDQLTDTTEEVVVFPTIGLVLEDVVEHAPVAIAPARLGGMEYRVEDLVRALERRSTTGRPRTRQAP